ncbi:MAG: archaellin/type IV pilin N-terminal domain-containing protein [Candidatus Aenigmarchaeota archaeon]
MKGITPIISIIILLLIAVSIAAAAWTYISGYWGGLVSSGMEITSTVCRDGTDTIIYVHNLGTERLNVTDGAGVDIDRTDGGTAVYVYDPADGLVEAGDTGQIKDTACSSTGVKNRCAYDILHLPSGRLHQTYVTCYG